MSARVRMAQLLAMPGEWLEIVAGAGAILWATSWVHLIVDYAQLPHGPAYRDLASLPAWVQAMLVLVAALGGLLQIATAAVNEARLRFCSSVGMAVLFGMLMLYVWVRLGLNPTTVCYLVITSLSLVAAMLLWLSGYVRS